jgi:class 3 adenylate cyclase
MTTRVTPEWALVTVLFVDIRGFTTFADRATAPEAVAYAPHVSPATPESRT